MKFIGDSFYAGFILGCILRNKVLKFGIKCISNGIKTYYSIKKPKKITKINSGVSNIEIVLKINNLLHFQDLFTDYRTNKDYLVERGVFRIKLGNRIIDYFNTHFENIVITPETICNISQSETYGYTILKTIGDIFIYVTYHSEATKYINVYTDNDIIISDHFKIKNNIFSNLICATVMYNLKSEYITRYLKLFVNTPNLTLYLLLLNYTIKPLSSKEIQNSELLLVNNNGNQKFLLNDKII